VARTICTVRSTFRVILPWPLPWDEGLPIPLVARRLSAGRRLPEPQFSASKETRYRPPPRRSVPLHSEDRKGNAYWHKTLWAVDPRYDGPILIRGGGIDPPRPLWFVVPSGTASRSQRRVRELHMPAERSKSWRYGVSVTILPGPGCYALQVDGTTFSEVIVFEARRSTT
jgi:hypothetical protein